MKKRRMKLWLLQLQAQLPPGHDPWMPWCDKVFSFVIRAETEQQAMGMADQRGGNETTLSIRPWPHAKLSTCVELTAEGEPGVVVTDYKGA